LKNIFSLLCCGLAITIPAAAANVTVYDSTADPVFSSDGIVDGPTGFSFSTPNNTSNLVDVKISLINTIIVPAASGPAVAQSRRSRPQAQVRTVAPNAAVGSITVTLMSSTTTNPPTPAAAIAVLGTLSDTSLTGAPALYDFAPSGTIGLAANTRYWIVATTANLSIARVNFSLTNAGTGVPGEFFTNGSFPSDSNTDGPYVGLVVVSPPTIPGVPVPPSVILMLIGLACVGFFAASRKFAIA
jgi:hypothetical protein